MAIWEKPIFIDALRAMEAREELSEIITDSWKNVNTKRGQAQRDKHLKNLERIRKYSLCEHYGPEVDAKIAATHEKLKQQAEARKEELRKKKEAELKKQEEPKRGPQKPVEEKKKAVVKRKYEKRN